jgi:drug/metabolite transporter (DMT)-like permease
MTGPVLWLPLLAAALFALGGLLMKRSASWSIGVWRTTFVSNLTTAAIFLPLFALGGRVPSWWDLWQPAVAGLLFVMGQMTTVLALTRGDVSIATPVLGLKILMVAVFATLLLAQPLARDIWLAALLATAGVALLNSGGGSKEHGHVWFSIVSALMAASAFALFDICVQRWSPTWGIGRFLPIMFAMAGLASLGFLPLLEDRLIAIPHSAWPWLLGGCVIIGAQSFLIVFTVAVWQQAAAINVVYSSRGLWSVVLLWLLGPSLGIGAARLSGWALACRLAGAGLLLAAVGLLAF